ncbi:hypothetical protein HHK36_018104 [Tetracentron sinense]|uniref:Homeobox-leucine zipper protein n=1 Tax=Tetracentron sinense TaxID=13715 RepID=A0A835DAY9_TETSI|nr:hypothetical protein HHK36_018104 [Tetracentron sinense]
MAWDSNHRTFVFQVGEPNSTFLYNKYPAPKKGVVVGLKCPSMAERLQARNQERKRRLTSDQLDSLERNFDEDMKLEPERKMRLAQELALPPRQVAVWFQNRRARWKAKQLELLYHELKRKFEVISREKQILQEEVMKLKAKLNEVKQVSVGFPEFSAKQVSVGFTEFSGEETRESTQVDYNPTLPHYWGALPTYS